MTCLCTGRPPCWVCEARAKQDALEAGMREVQDRINRLVEKLATDDSQDHHQTHGNGPVSAEERESGLGDDGLTDEERQEFLSEFRRGIGSKRINDGATGAERGEG